MGTTKDRILDAAEQLFARKGFDATSLREITQEAKVNLAAVNYHFQSKDALILAVLARRIEPVNQKRLALLDALEARVPAGPLPLDQLLEAFIRPVLETRAAKKPGFAPLLGRMFGEPNGLFQRVIENLMGQIAQRFLPAFQRSVPGLPAADLYWRLHFIIGSLAHHMAAPHLATFISRGLCEPSDHELVIRQMIRFMSAGLDAPPVT